MYSPFVRYTGGVPSRTCIVSFIDHQGLEHSVAVSAESLYEAAVLGLKAFRDSEIADASPGSTGRLKIALRSEESHEVEIKRIEEWLNCMGKSPREQALKGRLREALGLAR